MLEEKPVLYVFSSRRACNAFYAKQQDGFLPVVWSVKEFYNQISFIEGLLKVPRSVRQVLLAHAIKEVAQNLPESTEHLLVFEKSFLGYLDSSTFVAHFFNELAIFDLDMNQIESQDIYGDYANHLEVLKRILAHYQEQLEKHRFYDRILRIEPTLISAVLEKFTRIEFYLEGSLNNQEQRLLFKVASLVPVFLHVNCDRYNKDFLGFLKLDLEVNHYYKLDLSALLQGKPAIIKKQEQNLQVDHIRVYGFKTRLEQVGLALLRVQEWLQDGLDPSTLAIITPDSSITAYLKLLDIENNLNLAHGQDVEWVYFAYFQALKNLQINPPTLNASPLEELDKVCKQAMEQVYPTPPKHLQDFHEDFYNNLMSIKSLLKDYPLADLLELYLQELKKQRIDDVSGGKVRVLDVLECRGLSFERVVLLDFTDHLVPCIPDHNLFLNSTTRARLNIPTLKDHENLQKHYYYQILQNTKQVNIAYYVDDKTTHSKMLLELDLNTQMSPANFALFPPENKHDYLDEECKGKVLEGFSFSATKFNDYLTCPRRFYLKYIKNLTPPSKDQFNMGTFLHKLLKKHYEEHKNTPVKASDLLELAQDEQLNALQRLEFEVAVDKMSAFFEKEKEILQSREVLVCEKKFKTSIAGFTFNGKIDRIDRLEDGSYAILDYKYKSKDKLKVDTLENMEESQDYQLSIYHLALASSLQDARIRVYFYDLKKGELLEEYLQVVHFKQEQLQNQLKKLTSIMPFEKRPNKDNCSYCPYMDICGVVYEREKY
ncbi:PD-(D/E)XK nuclease family protein [Helicobacter suis]|uniref:PD-(D/E)XK nuclease family protein n=1 Tax=Helicobacter suis TaxID=104628 RepID=UPI00249358E4|nr:PD-(D/E)XK nuclease family protein [Helicobacter suis]